MSARKREPQKHRAVLLERDRGRCVYCGHNDPDDLTIDHLIPRRHGGGHELWNLAIACAVCNGRKFTKADGRALDILIRNLRLMVAETRLYVIYQRDLRALRVAL